MKKMEKGKDLEVQLHQEQTLEPSRMLCYGHSQRYLGIDVSWLPMGMPMSTWLDALRNGTVWLHNKEGIYWVDKSYFEDGATAYEPRKFMYPEVALANPETATTLVEELVPVDENGKPDDSKLKQFLQPRQLTKQEILEIYKDFGEVPPNHII